MVLIFFFFKQKTAYEMRISDWSSDVCSSDLSTAFQWLAPSDGSMPNPAFAAAFAPNAAPRFFRNGKTRILSASRLAVSMSRICSNRPNTTGHPANRRGFHKTMGGRNTLKLRPHDCERGNARWREKEWKEV